MTGRRILLALALALINVSAGLPNKLTNPGFEETAADRLTAWTPIIHVFPAWPPAWDASFRLLARGGFLVSSEIQAGNVACFEIESRLGEECRIQNPWNGPLTVRDESGATHECEGEFIVFPTTRGKKYSLLPRSNRGKTAGSSP